MTHSNKPRFALIMKKLGLAVMLVVCVLWASIYSISSNKQFGLMGGMAEEYLALGIHLNQTGLFQLSETSSKPFLFRPPGYVKFLDLAFSCYGQLKPRNHVFTSQQEAENEQRKIFQVVYVFQCFLLAASSLVLFLHAGQLIPPVSAFFLALAFGINPYVIIHVGVAHYELLHIFAILVSTWLLHLAFSSEGGLRKQILWVATGACFGVTTLIRPVSLILPAVLAVVVIWQFRSNLRREALHWLFFVVSFIVVLAPWTWRNYQAVKRFIPVNAQANAALWGSSSQALDLDANHYRWSRVWHPEGQEIYEAVTGEAGFQTSVYSDHVLSLEDEFWTRFKDNLATKPGVYLSNVCKNFALMTFGINSVVIKMFQHLQHTDGALNVQCLAPGASQDFYPSTASNAFTLLVMLLSLTGYWGMVASCVARDHAVLAPLVSFATLIIAHTITYTDIMYYYLRMPLLFIFVALFARHLHQRAFVHADLVRRVLISGTFVYTACLYWTVIVS
ncbi:MAG: ArnT family glycosyltransferase [Prosthecobacter sp.]|uniref:ArnT family glycosyltransferase n=1 Tax=Prosthecobacter sp. TaxID=1965333 RepID=UPI003904372A